MFFQNRCIGLLLLFLGICINRWTLQPLAANGKLSPWSGILLLCLWQLPATFTGTILLAGSKHARKWSHWTNAMLVVVSTMFSFALAEVVMRTLLDPSLYRPAPRAFVGEFETRASKNFAPDAQTGWRMQSNKEFRWHIEDHWNSYRANKQGFRSDKDFDDLKSSQSIVLIGDSFTFGTGVNIEQTFGGLLNSALGRSTAVYNLAMPGFGLDQMWMSVRHQALPLKPSLVIVAFIDEDLDRSLTAFRDHEGFNKPTFELEEGILRPQNHSDKPTGLKGYLATYSEIWKFGQKLLSAPAHGIPLGDWWLRNEAIFKAIIAECRNSGTTILFVRLPEQRPSEFLNLARLMADQRVGFLDLGSSKIRPRHNIHFPEDGHIDEAGHKFVADMLITWISQTLPSMPTNQMNEIRTSVP